MKLTDPVAREQANQRIVNIVDFYCIILKNPHHHRCIHASVSVSISPWASSLTGRHQ